MNILETIIAAKKLEVESRKKEIPIRQLEQSPWFQQTIPSLRRSLQQPGTNGIIAEFKRKSPSKGIIHANADAKEITRAYAAGGASGISVLTDTTFFGGSWTDLEAAVGWGVPVLRKDFIIDEYQLIEARAHGAAVILLIAACLTPTAVKQLAETARMLGLEVLLELHDQAELGHIHPSVTLVGINNRNLKNFEVNLQHSIELAAQIPAEFPAIAESGIDSVETILQLQSAGFSGFLMGEYFMKQDNPGASFLQFSQVLQNARNVTEN
ncbi:MAG: indole-3-glycerol phosphate synthase TrpC [Chitinophagia bacterium]|nr:indole-3-glycerol phosphate synthase TrpC [Chitinophagia bacterium]